MDVHRELAMWANPLATSLERIEPLLLAPCVGKFKPGVAGVDNHCAVEVHDLVVEPGPRLEEHEVGPLDFSTLTPVDARRIGQQPLNLLVLLGRKIIGQL